MEYIKRFQWLGLADISRRERKRILDVSVEY